MLLRKISNNSFISKSIGRPRFNSLLSEAVAEITDVAAKSQAAAAERTMKRFWKTANVSNSNGRHIVHLDTRKLRTPAGNVIDLPSNKGALALLIAHEWQSQDKVIKAHALPITSLASRALDSFKDQSERIETCDKLIKYFETDATCYFEDKPSQLVELQEKHWRPIVEWANKRYNTTIHVFENVLASKQPEESRKLLHNEILQFDAFTLAAFERIVMHTKSFLIALAVVDGHLSIEDASQAARVEVLSQIARWGEVEDSHDVDHHDIRKQIGSAACTLIEMTLYRALPRLRLVNYNLINLKRFHMPPKQTKLSFKKKVASESEEDDFEASDGSDVAMPPPKAKKSTSNKRKSAQSDDDDDIDVPEPKSSSSKQKSASETYQKLSQLEHVLKRPDMYIGSCMSHEDKHWVFDEETKALVEKDISIVPGLYKIMDEILVNAADNKTRDPRMDLLKVEIDRESNKIHIHNNGKGIPVEIHSKEKIYIPELIFGSLLTSSNYDDDDKKLTGGRNGFGAKLTNIYSTEFTVETADSEGGKKFKQTFRNNMGDREAPKITSNSRGEEYTKITFKPDLARFSMDKISDDMYALMTKRVYDMAGCLPGVKVYLNGTRLPIRNFKQYVEMYVTSTIDNEGESSTKKPTIIHERVNDRWEIAFALSDGVFREVSFVNSIATTKGGTHVDHVTNQITTKLGEIIKKKNKGANVTAGKMKNQMWVFVNSMIENPAFDSQTKETLTLKATQFGSKCPLSEEFHKKVSKSGIVDNILDWAKFDADRQMAKGDTKTKKSKVSIKDYEEANKAGGKEGHKCTLILTEGLSAKTQAMTGSQIVGRDYYGVFPLRGKLLNVRDASHTSIMNNAELTSIKTIIGLAHKKEYRSVTELRYGSIMIMTDQDHDGSHIKGLLINYFDHFYPSLLKIPGFLVEFITPIIKLFKRNKVVRFFTIPEFENWKAENDGGRGWRLKYYKGLGTSEPDEMHQYFRALDRHRIPFSAMQEGDHELIDMAFNKKRTEDRKEWLRGYNPGTFLDHDVEEIPYKDFVNKELILFSMSDNARSIPSMVDGFKPGQRKVLYGTIKRNLKSEIKVAQLGMSVAENTAYHHGETSLIQTIVGMAQNFVGSNNLNILSPNGQFGSRREGGKDAAAARYIFTAIPRITRTIFHPDDDPILTYLREDDEWIEPEWYVPIIPMVLVNGADGIGTGWSTTIPNYNPSDLVANIRRKLNNQDIQPMIPWYRGFTGNIERLSNDRFKNQGIIEQIDDDKVRITELPVRVWTVPYKEEKLKLWVQGSDKQALIKDYEEHDTTTTVEFIVTLDKDQMKTALSKGLHEYFKLNSSIATSNIVCFNPDGKIKKYTAPEEILEEFFYIRLKYYQLRKDYQMHELGIAFDRISNQARFIKMIIDRELIISNRKRKDIVDELRAKKFTPYPKQREKKRPGEVEIIGQDEEEEENVGGAGDYDYLLSMQISSLTVERMEQLLKQRDSKEEELNNLAKLQPQDLWNVDLDKFMEEWEELLERDIEDAKKNGNKSKNKGATAKRIQKAIKKKRDDDDDDDDFSAAPKRKKASPVKKKTQPKKEDKDNIDDIEVTSKTTKKAPAKKHKIESDDDSPPAKRQASTKIEDSENPEKKPTKKSTKAPAKKAPAKKKSIIDDSEEDKLLSKGKRSAANSEDGFDSEDDSMPVAPRAKSGRTTKAMPTYVDLSDDEDDF
ncbi:DNA topoisomerase II [Wallemia mellicola]|nr:DNA topoisomerase II [Wallemia mellicola]